MKLLLIKTLELNGELQRNRPKRFNLPCRDKTKKNYKEEKN